MLDLLDSSSDLSTSRNRKIYILQLRKLENVYINYCITTWGYQRNRLVKIQKKAVRIITLNKYNSHTEPLFKKLNTLKVEDLLKLQELKFYYKYRHQNLPVYFLNWQITPNTYIHNYNTRRTTELHTYRTKHEFAKILKYNLPHVINNIPVLVIDKIVTHSLKGFSSYAKNYMLQKYNDTCTLLNCYICQLN